jgi:multidrug transporter EmrE-like cation transporter
MLIFLSVSLNALAQIALRKAMLAIGILPSFFEKPITVIFMLLGSQYLWGGMLCYALSIGLWLAVLSRVQVGVAYPMLSIGYILAAAMGYFLLGENLSIIRMSGIFLICAGVFLVARTA